MKKSTRLRELINAEETLFVPGVYNAMTARILEKVGFPAVYMTGYGTSIALLGMPDAGLAPMTEMQLNARYIANAVSVPVIADSDNGYGNAVNVVRTVKEYIQTGVAAIHIEDQVIPKRCGHVAGRRVIPMDEACGKFRAADFARKETDPEFIIIARTDARGAHGGTLDDAIERANAYLQSGADVAFVEGPKNIDELQRVCAEVDGPVLYNQTGMSPRLSHEQMQQLGIALTIQPSAMFSVTLQAVYDMAVALRDEGPLAEQALRERLKDHPMGDYHDFAGFDEIVQLEEKFMHEDELQKYTDSVGHQPQRS